MSSADLLFRPEDPAGAVVSRLHAISEGQERRLGYRWFAARRWLQSRLSGGSLNWKSPQVRTFLMDKLVALDRDKCRLCYLLCRAGRANRIVEIGTSFGVSTIYLAAAARDNCDSGAGKALVIATELESSKAAMARFNLEQAGLDGFVDLREGDFRQTLEDLDGPVDFVLLDIWAPLAVAAIKLIAPRLRSGAIVACDNIQRLEREYAGYLDYIRDPANHFYSLTLPLKGGFGLSMRLG